MSVGKRIAGAQGGGSWIRKMFEEGVRLKAQWGADSVADLSLGNPVVEPPPQVAARLAALAAEPPTGRHRYMQNGGFPATRAAVAAHLAARTGVPYTGEQVLMTVGAGGALNVVFHALLDPGDEVVVLSPYFVEYRYYIENHGGVMVDAPTDRRFRPDPARIAAALGPRTRAVVVNAPNNPTGVVYPASDFDMLAGLLREAGRRAGRPIYLISDEPYRAIAYDGVDVPWPVRHYEHTIHVTSFSKDLALPGERIGYLAIDPRMPDAAAWVGATTFANRTLGFVNAPALQQRLVEGLLDVSIDLTGYAAKRATLLAALDRAGYKTVRPGGAFYLFPAIPQPPSGSLDDPAFVRLCLEERLLVVPGSGFGTPGHFRMSYAVADRDVELAVDALARVAARIANGSAVPH